jgi:uncharacterized membrane protein
LAARILIKKEHTIMQKKLTLGWLAPVLWLFGSLAILSAVYRMWITTTALATGVMPADPGDVHYVKHVLMISLHIVPGLIFLVLGPLQFTPSIRTQWPRFHRWSGRVFIASGLVTAVTAMTMNMVFPPVGGLFKSLAVYIFSIAQIVTLIVALRAILRRDIARHRAWMIRAFAIGLSVSTMRIFFIPAYILYGIPNDFTIGLGMWVGFVVNVLAAEFILWRERVKHSVTKVA